MKKKKKAKKLVAMNTTVNLVVGDWSGDGHNKKETVAVKCNMTVNSLRDAYKLGCKKLGFDLANDVAADYEDATISSEYIKTLIDAGFKWGDESDEDSHTIWVDEFANIWLFIAALGSNNKLKYSIITNADINIGGYGLLGS